MKVVVVVEGVEHTIESDCNHCLLSVSVCSEESSLFRERGHSIEIKEYK